MRRAKRQAIKQLKARMYPQRPWYNFHDLYGRRRHQMYAAMSSGTFGSFSGMTIVRVGDGDAIRSD